MAALCLVGLTFVSCEKSEGLDGDDFLEGTRWSGRALETDVTVTFYDDECSIVLSGYVNGAGVGTYTANKTSLVVTITRLSGDNDNQLHVGDIITGTYTASKMHIRVLLYGEYRDITLYKE